MNAAFNELVVASLLANFFEAGWSIQVLVGDTPRSQYDASRLARPAVERHLRTMCDTAAALPAATRALMPRVDWQGWEDLGRHLPPRGPRDRDLLWHAVSTWLPADGAELRRYRRLLPDLWRFRL